MDTRPITKFENPLLRRYAEVENPLHGYPPGMHSTWSTFALTAFLSRLAQVCAQPLGRPSRLGEKQAEALIDAHLSERGWRLTDLSTTERGYKLPSGREADYVFKINGKVVAVLEAKRPGSSLPAALDQARGYAEELASRGFDVPLIFASDGYMWLRQHLAARTLPETLAHFPTLAEFKAFFNPQIETLLADLRSYQRAAVSQVYASVTNGRQRMYLQMATGTGKTLTAAAVPAPGTNATPSP